MNSLAIIVLNWNNATDTIKCVSSLLKNNRHSHIVVVDNGSDLADITELKAFLKNKKGITLLTNHRNLGFTGGVNTGIQWAIEHDIEAVVLINNDAVVEPNWLKMLLDAMVTHNTSIVTGLLLNETGKKIDSTGEQYSIWGLPFPRSRGLKTNQALESGFVFGATGGATLYKTELFKEIGLFDESFFAYYEDVDISFRAQLAGHTVYYTNEAIAYHKQGATSKKIPGFTVYQTFKNLPLLFIKNVPTRLIIPIGVRFFVAYWLMFGNAIKNGSGLHALKGWLMSVWYTLTRAFWLRLQIQRKKKVSAKYIDSILHHDLPPDQTGIRSLRRKVLGR